MYAPETVDGGLGLLFELNNVYLPVGLIAFVSLVDRWGELA